MLKRDVFAVANLVVLVSCNTRLVDYWLADQKFKWKLCASCYAYRWGICFRRGSPSPGEFSSDPCSWRLPWLQQQSTTRSPYYRRPVSGSGDLYISYTPLYTQKCLQHNLVKQEAQLMLTNPRDAMLDVTFPPSVHTVEGGKGSGNSFD